MNDDTASRAVTTQPWQTGRERTVPGRVDVRPGVARARIRKRVEAFHGHPFRNDSLLALLVLAYNVLTLRDTTMNPFGVSLRSAQGIITSLSVVVLSVCLALRRRSPLLCVGLYAAMALLLLQSGASDVGMSTLVGWVAVHAVAARTSGRDRRIGTIIIWMTVVAIAAKSLESAMRSELVQRGDLFRQTRFFFLVNTQWVGLYLTAWIAGRYTRQRDETIAELAERSRELEASRRDAERQVVLAERLRISRDVHDVVAHHVSVMGIQAGAARLLIAASPERAAAAVHSIELSARSAVDDLANLLCLLRDQDGPDAAAPGRGEFDDGPAPGIHALSRLCDDAEAVGVPIDFALLGAPVEVPRSVGTCAYRIVQEALTNARKHGAERAPVHVRLEYRGDGVFVRIESTLGDDRPTHASAGHGLVGMRERVALVGGTLAAGADGYRYTVSAWLPFERARSRE